jgi:hypothetical protein
MNLYHLLRRLIAVAPLQEPEKNDALKLIDDLEARNAFGTTAALTTSQAHACWFEPYYHLCIYCGKAENDQ